MLPYKESHALYGTIGQIWVPDVFGGVKIRQRLKMAIFGPFSHGANFFDTKISFSRLENFSRNCPRCVFLLEKVSRRNFDGFMGLKFVESVFGGKIPLFHPNIWGPKPSYLHQFLKFFDVQYRNGKLSSRQVHWCNFYWFFYLKKMFSLPQTDSSNDTA